MSGKQYPFWLLSFIGVPETKQYPASHKKHFRDAIQQVDPRNDTTRAVMDIDEPESCSGQYAQQQCGYFEGFPPCKAEQGDADGEQGEGDRPHQPDIGFWPGYRHEAVDIGQCPKGRNRGVATLDPKQELIKAPHAGGDAKGVPCCGQPSRLAIFPGKSPVMMGDFRQIGGNLIGWPFFEAMNRKIELIFSL
jgi:hypothetical protein